jgi:hypothetical protein
MTNLPIDAEQAMQSTPGQSAADTWVDGLLPGVAISILCGAIYLMSRPPLFDYDGYMYRFYAMQPDRWQNTNPHHLLWNPIEILLATIAKTSGHPSTVPFQVFGVVVACAVLVLFFGLLRKVGINGIVASASELLIAFAPSFWFLTLQNHPYPLTCLVLVVYLTFWASSDTYTPAGWTLIAAGVALIIAALLHQALILLVSAGAIVLVLFGEGSLAQRLSRGVLWGMMVSLGVLVAYLLFWSGQSVSSGLAANFLRWTASYAETEHPPQLIQLGFFASFARSAIGLSRSILQSDQVQSFLGERYSAKTVLALYGISGLALCVIAGVLIWHRAANFLRMMQTSVIFTLSLLSAFASWSFAFAWEAATAQYWLFGLFPILLCVGMLLRTRRSSLVFAAVALVVCGWNLRFNRDADLDRSSESPEPMLQSIDQHVGSHDIFIILGDGGYGDTNYDLLLDILNAQERNPAVLILNDFVIPAGVSRAWTKGLSQKIESTLSSGGKVFVAKHLFDADSYDDLSHADDAFNEEVDQRYLTIDSPKIYSEVQTVFKGYDLIDSDFSIGSDKYFLLKRKQPEARNTATEPADSPATLQTGVQTIWWGPKSR